MLLESMRSTRDEDDRMLTIYRRHLDSCEHRLLGRSYAKCACPIHCDGVVGGAACPGKPRHRQLARAVRRAAELEEEASGGQVRKPLADTIDVFLADRTIESSTARKYRRIGTYFNQYAERVGVSTVDKFLLVHLDGYRVERKLSPLSWSKELQLLRTFFDFCMKRKWCKENPAKDMTMPGDPKPRPRESYSRDELSKIISASDRIGQGSYERLRSRAMVLLMRYHGLRISDVATLERERVRGGEILLYAQKNGKVVWAPAEVEVLAALAVLPLPKGATSDCQYFFWNGSGSREGQTKTVGRTLQAVFSKSGVENAIAHRFRHTLCNEILVNGGTIEDAANILGDSPAVIRKHYVKWSVSHQARITEVLNRVRGARLAHEENNSISGLFSLDGLVPGVGLEPTLPLPEKGF